MRVFWDLGWFFQKHWPRYLLGIVMLLIIELLALIPPWLVGSLVNHFVRQNLTPSMVWRDLAAIVAIELVSYALRYGWRAMLYGGSLWLAFELREKLYRQFTNLPPAFYHQHPVGELMAHSTNDVQAVQETAGDGVLTLADSVLTASVVVAVMVTRIRFTLTVVALLPMPIMAYLIGRYGKRLHNRFSLAQRAFSDLTDRVQTVFQGIRVVRAFGEEDATHKEFAVLSSAVMQKNLDVARVDALFQPTIFVMVSLSYFLALSYGGWLVFRHAINIGQLTTFTLYLGELIWPMMAFGFFLNIVERGRASYARIHRLLTVPPTLSQDPPDAYREVVNGPLSIRIARFCYPGRTVPALADIALNLPPGSLLVVVGPTGSGKTTLFRLLLREYALEHGTITVGGVSLAQLSWRALHQTISYAPQDDTVFSLSVRDNIAFGCPEASLDDIVRVSQIAHIHHEIVTWPDGYDTWVGERGITLSGGQKQRLALARALLRPSPIVLLDDALAAVDAQTEVAIVNHLRARQRHRTIMMSTHRLFAAACADWVVVLTDGRVTEQGPPAQLRQAGGWYARQWRHQQLQAAIDEAR